jgi:hypothetical protein
MKNVGGLLITNAPDHFIHPHFSFPFIFLTETFYKIEAIIKDAAHTLHTR